jgi:hypothetical protein
VKVSVFGAFCFSTMALTRGAQIMRKVYRVPLGWFVVYMAFLTALCASALTLALLRWPVAVGVLLAAGVSVAMLVTIYQIVRCDRLSARMAPPARDAAATLDGKPVKEVTVIQ